MPRLELIRWPDIQNNHVTRLGSLNEGLPISWAEAGWVANQLLGGGAKFQQVLEGGVAKVDEQA